MSKQTPLTALVSWPSAPLTNKLVLSALASLESPPNVVTALPKDGPTGKLLQWSTYDAIDHDLTLERSSDVLSSSYTIRKALIRKHYLSHCTHNYLVKHPNSPLKDGIPRTWELELSFADELDDKWTDELWDLGEELDKGTKWFILKPGMADRGMGIRLFHTKDELEKIFLGFEEADSDEEPEDANEDERNRNTAVVTSQLRHFVIQEYLSSPLLLDPLEVPLGGNGQTARPVKDLKGHKFHIRAYCVASGALRVYLYTRMLALFSAVPYASPTPELIASEQADLSAHLTNTSLQVERGEAGVRLLDELVGCHILGQAGLTDDERILTEEDVEDLKFQMGEILGETFHAALDMSVHFQPLPNAFEMFGVDFLVTHNAKAGVWGRRFEVSLLEVNSEPAIELTGPRLTWILESLFKSVGRVCVEPFFRDDARAKLITESWDIGETREHLRKCLDVNVRGGW